MKRMILVLLLSLIGLSVNAQITFQKAYGGLGDDNANSVWQTADGGFIIAGSTTSYGADTTNSDVYLFKTDSHGDTLWTRTYGGDSTDYGFSVQQTTDGGYIIVGSTNSFGAGNADVYLIKTNSAGDTMWTKTYGGTNIDVGNYVRQTFDGGYIIAGYTMSYGAGNFDVYLIKTNSAGDTLWTRTYGGTFTDLGYSVQQTTDSGYIVTGYRNISIGGAYDAYLIKTNSIGDTMWTKSYGGTNNDEGYSVQQTTDGGYIIAGETQSFGIVGLQYVYLIHTNAVGDTLWTRIYGGIIVGNAQGNSVQQTTDGGYIIAGSTGTNVDYFYLIKTDSVGDTLWTKTYGGTSNSQCYSVQQTTDGGYIITGYSNSFSVGGTNKVYLIKTDANGNSGCNQGNPPTVQGTTTTQASSPLTKVSSGGIVNHTITIMHHGGIVTPICYNGINEIRNNYYISLYPNPTSGTITLSYNSQTPILNSQLKIYDVLGQEVYTQAITNPNQTTINVTQLSNGVYFYQLTNNTETYRGKFVVKK